MQGSALTSYLREVTDRVRPRWQSSIPVTNPPGRVVVLMKGNGSVRNVRVHESSGMTKFDQLAIDAINPSKAFPSLPADFAESQLIIELEFSHVLVGLDPKVTLRPLPPLK